MSQSFKKLGFAFWTVLPLLMSLFLLVVYLVPKHMSGLGSVMPLLPIIPVFYWGATHSRDMPYWFVFLLGLLMDAATGQPMGLSSVLYVLFLAMLHAQHKYIHKEGFVIKWGYFGLLLGVMGVLHWLLLFAFYAQSPGVKSALVQWLLTVCCYPCFHYLFDRLHQIMSNQRWRLLHGR